MSKLEDQTRFQKRAVSSAHALSCPVCDFFTMSGTLLQTHISLCHSPPLNYTTLTCPACNWQSTQEEIMKQHLNFSHHEHKTQLHVIRKNYVFTPKGFHVEDMSRISNSESLCSQISNSSDIFRSLYECDNNMSASGHSLIDFSLKSSPEKRPISTNGQLSSNASRKDIDARACQSAPPGHDTRKLSSGGKIGRDRFNKSQMKIRDEPEQEEALDMSMSSNLFSQISVSTNSSPIKDKISPALQMMQQMTHRFPFPYYPHNYPNLSTLLSSFTSPTFPPPNSLNFYKSMPPPPPLPALHQRPPPPSIRDFNFSAARLPWTNMSPSLPEFLPSNPLSSMWNLGNQFRRNIGSNSLEGNGSQNSQNKLECNNNNNINRKKIDTHNLKCSKEADLSSQVSRNSTSTLTSSKESQDILVRSHRQNFTPLQNRILLEWYHQHHDKPYPSTEDTKMLAKRANLSYPQVKKWFANKRARTSLCSKNRASKQHANLSIRQPTLPFPAFQHSFNASNSGPHPYNPALFNRFYNYSRMKLANSLPAASPLKSKHKNIY